MRRRFQKPSSSIAAFYKRPPSAPALLHGFVLLTLALLLVSSSSIASPGNAKPELDGPSRAISLEVINGLVSIDVVDADLALVLRELGQKARVNVAVDEKIGRAHV